MNSINIYIGETLDVDQLAQLRADLAGVPHVTHVAVNPAQPHELLVEYEEHHNLPVKILNHLEKAGLHADIQYC